MTVLVLPKRAWEVRRVNYWSGTATCVNVAYLPSFPVVFGITCSEFHDYYELQVLLVHFDKLLKVKSTAFIGIKGGKQNLRSWRRLLPEETHRGTTKMLE
jgi:hypothetical protein